MTKYVVTKKVVGELYIPILSQSYTAGKKFTLNDEQSKDKLIALAESKGFIAKESEIVELTEKEAVADNIKKSGIKRIGEDATKKDTNMLSWDLENKKTVNKEESSIMVQSRNADSFELDVVSGGVKVEEKDENIPKLIDSVGKKKIKSKKAKIDDIFVDGTNTDDDDKLKNIFVDGYKSDDVEFSNDIIDQERIDLLNKQRNKQ